MKNIPLVIVSCDAMSDTWLPYMLLWDKFGKNKDRQVFLFTESADFPARGDVRVVHPKEGEFRGSEDWIGILRSCLKQIDTEYIFFTLDDLFLKGPIDWDKITTYSEFAISNNCDSLTLGVHDTTRQGLEIGIQHLLEVLPSSPYWLTTSPALWKKDSLLLVLAQRSGSPWDFEFTEAKKFVEPIKQYMVNRKTMVLSPLWPYYAEYVTGVYPTPIISDTAIAKGKWQKGIPKFLEFHGIGGIQYWKRGFHSVDSVPPAGLTRKMLWRLAILYNLLVDLLIRPKMRRKALLTLTSRFARILKSG